MKGCPKRAGASNPRRGLARAAPRGYGRGMIHARVTLPGGLELFLRDSGEPRDAAPGTPLLCIHGNSCDGGFFAPQAEHFAPARRVLAPDLRGHGASGAPDCDYTFALLADDLAGLLDALGVPRVVAVGHSMGGAIALELCLRRPDLVAGVACLDSTLLTPPGRPSRVHSLLDGLRSTAWQGYFIRYFEALFAPEDDPERMRAILERMLRTPQHVVVSLFEHWRIADGAAALRACSVPLVYVASSRPHADREALLQHCPSLLWGQVVACGHFLTLEAPDQVNAMLERFLFVSGL